MLSNLGKGNIKYRRRHIDVKADCWSAWFVRPALEQTCSCQCEKKKKKKKLRKQLRQWVWMAVSQASQTPGLGPNSSPPVGGKRPTAMEVAVGQRHLWLNTKIFWYSRMLLLEVLLKSPQQPAPLLRGRGMLRHCEILREAGHAGLAQPVSCRHLYVFCIQRATSSSVLTVFMQGYPDFLLSTTCQHLLSAHCCGVFALHLLEVTCQSHSTGRSATPVKLKFP